MTVTEEIEVLELAADYLASGRPRGSALTDACETLHPEWDFTYVDAIIGKIDGRWKHVTAAEDDYLQAKLDAILERIAELRRA